MAKRTATTELNHDNWNKEEDPEDAGSFSRASEDALKKRVIKVAKRRNPLSSVQSEDGKGSAFGALTGFGKSQSANNSSTFGFLTKLNQTDAPKTNGTTEPETKPGASPDKNLDEYYAKLKGLNESVTEWIKKHVSTNPFINLQPIFKDYDKYIAELEKAKSQAPLDKADKTTTFKFGAASTSTATTPTFSFGAATTTPSTGFSFGATTTTSSSDAAKALFSFGSSSSGDNPPKPTTSFGTSSSGSFSFTSTTVKPADAPTSEDPEEDEPPKVEFTPVVEEGHVYSTRCKVFVKKDGNFADHGVGTLYVKPVPDSKKFQLIVRAETNLGRLICNFILSEGIPMQRMGKKDVMLVCVPNPETQPPPVPVLLRVKSPEDADELLKRLQEHQK